MNPEYTNRQKEAIVSLIIEMINADQQITLEELHASNVINAELGITTEVFEVGRALDVAYAAEVVSRMTDEQKLHVGFLLTRIIDADGVADAEIELLNHLCAATGIDRAVARRDGDKK